MAHRHYETFDLERHELGDQSDIFPLMFLSDADGDITGLTVPFEPSVDALRFSRLPDAPARDPEVLSRLSGTYAMGPVEIVVTVQGDHVLTVAAPAPRRWSSSQGTACASASRASRPSPSIRARRHRRRHAPGRPAARHIPPEAVSLERAFEADDMER